MNSHILRIIWMSIAIVSFSIHETYTCRYTDTKVKNDLWKTGREGKLCVSIGQSSSFKVTLTNRVNNWNIYCTRIESVSSSKIYTLSFKTWCEVQPDGNICTGYTMWYQDASVEVLNIAVNGQTCTNEAVEATEAPTTDIPPSTASSTTTTILPPTTTIPATTVQTLTSSLTTNIAETASNCINVANRWNAGETGEIKMTTKSSFTNWKIKFVSDQKINNFQFYGGELVSVNGGNTEFVFKSLPWNNNLAVNEVFKHGYLFKYTAGLTQPTITSVTLTSVTSQQSQVCESAPVLTTATTSKSTVPPITTTQETTTIAPETTTIAPETTTISPEITATSQATTTLSSEYSTTFETTDTTVTDWCLDNPAPGTCSSYKCALHLSLLFYEAQRSGELPLNGRISWRSSSTTKDGLWSNVPGVNLTGGYFDAGDFVKFNFPQASAMTMLAWGMEKYGKGYKAAGEYNHGLDTLRWGMDYFIKCHTKPNELWGQVGIGEIDHNEFERPEIQYSEQSESDYSKKRQIYKLDVTNPGSELAGEIAASFAASAIVFKNKDLEYSTVLLQHAKELYTFAVKYQKKYSDSILDAAKYYKSYSGYYDELGLAAIWLYKATGVKQYLDDAKFYWNQMNQTPNELSWDNKARAVAVLLAEATKENTYIDNVKHFYTNVNSLKETIYGTKFIQMWGSNRHISNVAFALLVASDTNITAFNYKSFSTDQINKLLGKNSRQQSFLIGYGPNSPKNPHHASSACPDPPKSCGWAFYNSNNDNTFLLKGALVGGPKCTGEDCYADVRTDYVANEVTLDYNAGFQSALAGLIENC